MTVCSHTSYNQRVIIISVRKSTGTTAWRSGVFGTGNRVGVYVCVCMRTRARNRITTTVTTKGC